MSESDKDKKPEFLAAIKLVSGEEILSMVTHVQDVNGDYLIVENPIQVEEVTLPNKIVGAKVQPWMKFSREEEWIKSLLLVPLNLHQFIMVITLLQI